MQGIDPVHLARAVSELSDVAIDPAAWPQAMERICAAVQAEGAALLQSDNRTPDVPRTPGVAEAYPVYFKNDWHMRDIRAARGVPLVLAGAPVIIDEDIVSTDELRTAAFYNELMIPCGLPWFAAVGFWSGAALWGLIIHRTARQGLFEPADKRLLASLSPALTEAASLSKLVGSTALAGVGDALSAVRQAAVAIGRSGAVLLANPAAQAMFGPSLYVKQGRLCLADRRAGMRLEQVIEALDAARDRDPVLIDPLVIRREGEAPVIARTLSVPVAARSPFLGARALIAFNPVEARAGPSAAMLARVFGLTQAEAKIASIVAEGASPEQAAAELGIARETARNQLKAVFAKTSTHRQGELVALLASLSL